MKSAKRLRGIIRFCRENSLLLILLIMMLIGAYGGVVSASTGGATPQAELIQGTLAGFCTGIGRSALMPTVLLGVLFLAGLTAFGVPFALAVPPFFGLGIGSTAAAYYATGWRGVWTMTVLLLPRAVCCAACLTAGAVASVRMSVRLCRQLTPGGGMGGVWPAYRQYRRRFLLLAAVTAAGAAGDTVWRFLIGKVV